MRRNSKALLALLISVVMGSFGASTALFHNSSKVETLGSAGTISLTQKQGITNQSVESGKWKSTTVAIENGSSHNLDVETELTISKPLPKGMSITVNGKSAFVGKTKEIYTYKDLKPKGSSEVAAYDIKIQYDKLPAGERMESESFTLNSKSVGKLRGTNWTTKQLSSSATITYDGGNNTLKVPVIYKPIGTLGEGKLTATLKSPDSTEETVNVLNSKGGVDLDQVSHSKGTYFKGTLEVYNDQELQFISNSGSWSNDDLGIILPNSKGGNAKIIRGSGKQVKVSMSINDLLERSEGVLHLIRIPKKQINFTSEKTIKDTIILKNDKGKVIDEVSINGTSAKSKFVDTHEFNVNMPMSKINNFEYTYKPTVGSIEMKSGEEYEVSGNIQKGFTLKKAVPLFKFTLLPDGSYSVDGFVNNIEEAIEANGLDKSFRYNPIIPSEHKGKPVTLIGESAFERNQLTSVAIPDSVIEIGDWAFASNKLTSVEIPNSVTKIRSGAFYGNKLTSVEIPNSVTKIGDWAFNDNQLTSVVIPDSVTKIGYDAFRGNQLTSVDIPDSVTKIGGSAFAYNKLTSVVIPDSVTEISFGAFDDNQLTSVVIPDSVTKIDDYAFNGNQLTSVVIPDSVTEIGISAFDNQQRYGNTAKGVVYAYEIRPRGDLWPRLRWYEFDTSLWSLKPLSEYKK